MDAQNITAVATPVAVETEIPALPMENGMEQSLLERANDFLKSKGLPPWAIEVTVFGGIFVILGYLFKSFGRWLLFLLLAVVAAIVVLHYAHIASMPLEKLTVLAGVKDIALQDMPNVFVAWAREHVISCISAVIGFFVGWKLG
jgi:hypothetical protein